MAIHWLEFQLPASASLAQPRSARPHCQRLPIQRTWHEVESERLVCQMSSIYASKFYQRSMTYVWITMNAASLVNSEAWTFALEIWHSIIESVFNIIGRRALKITTKNGAAWAKMALRAGYCSFASLIKPNCASSPSMLDNVEKKLIGIVHKRQMVTVKPNDSRLPIWMCLWSFPTLGQ